MKYIKYIAAALLLTASLASCDTNGVESGTPGNTTVQFAAAEIKDGFGAGVVYVPLTIESDTKEGMNSCSVQAKLKVVTTGEKFEGTPDVDGKSGDYRITSLDVNFPAFDNYYDDKNPEEYKDSETGKWVKKVQVEVLILNDAVEELNFTLEIESATTTIGEQKQCTVVLEKTARDRICGTYSGVATISDYAEGEHYEEPISWNETIISWNSTYKCFDITYFAEWTYTYTFYAYWDEGTSSLYMYPADPMIMYDDTSVIYSAFYTAWGATIAERTLASDVVILDYDIEAGTIKFPEDLFFTFAVYTFDAEYNPVEMLGRMTRAYKGAVLTKK